MLDPQYSTEHTHSLSKMCKISSRLFSLWVTLAAVTVILASMIDAHPNAILIAHEFILFLQLLKNVTHVTCKMSLYNALYKNSHKQSTHGWRSMNLTGYNLRLSLDKVASERLNYR